MGLAVERRGNDPRGVCYEQASGSLTYRSCTVYRTAMGTTYLWRGPSAADHLSGGWRASLPPR